MNPLLSEFSDLTTQQNWRDASQPLRQLLKSFNEEQFTQFDAGESIEHLLSQRSALVDKILKEVWKEVLPPSLSQKAGLIAVGGYGREEMQPYSDVDILILCESPDDYDEIFSQFITFIWDIGFQVGQAVRSFQETIDAAKEDVATATNLLESRWICGDYEGFQKLQLIWKSKQFWPSHAFFDAKLKEQEIRHERFNNAMYQLEPNVKESPGGLRDIQTLLWVAKRHFNANSLQDLVAHAFISNEEFHQIKETYAFLNRVRFALHKLKKHHEDRLLFDNQQKVAQILGFHESDEQQAVEAFMSVYYQNVRIVSKLNEILLQHFTEDIFHQGKEVIVKINPRFRIINDYLDVHQETLFEKNPTALLEIFIILENNSKRIKGIRSRTIRLIRNHLYLIDDEFRNDSINQALFIEIFRQPVGVHSAVSRMLGYGILEAYLPDFQHTVGLMQFNIFHAYTVDIHTIMVIRNMRRFFIPEHDYEFPTISEIAKHLCKPEILILAGLFHDIGKGLGGSHEILGAEMTVEFSKNHHLSQNDAELLYWLVRTHLDFSSVAQSKDLSDPQVIADFAKLVETQSRLDYLYLLTVADVLSTSKEVWNEWKNSLFLQLYHSTSQFLDKAENTPKTRAKLALRNQEKARELLAQRGIKVSEFQTLWNQFSNTLFFSHQSANEIARITKLLSQTDMNTINVSAKATSNKGASELIIYSHEKDFLFAHFTHILEKMSLNIVEAKTYSGQHNMTLALIYFFDQNNEPVTQKEKLDKIAHTLQTKLAEPIPETTPNKPIQRRIRSFDTPTEISLTQNDKRFTELSVNTKDIPGLLAKIGQVFRRCNIRVHDAKIHTIGEKAEDVFLITNLENKPLLAKAVLDELKNELKIEIED